MIGKAVRSLTAGIHFRDPMQRERYWPFRSRAVLPQRPQCYLKQFAPKPDPTRSLLQESIFSSHLHLLLQVSSIANHCHWLQFQYQILLACRQAIKLKSTMTERSQSKSKGV